MNEKKPSDWHNSIPQTMAFCVHLRVIVCACAIWTCRVLHHLLLSIERTRKQRSTLHDSNKSARVNNLCEMRNTWLHSRPSDTANDPRTQNKSSNVISALNLRTFFVFARTAERNKPVKSYGTQSVGLHRFESLDFMFQLFCTDTAQRYLRWWHFGRRFYGHRVCLTQFFHFILLWNASDFINVFVSCIRHTFWFRLTEYVLFDFDV